MIVPVFPGKEEFPKKEHLYFSDQASKSLLFTLLFDDKNWKFKMNAGILFIPSEMDLLFSRRVKPGFFLQVGMVDFQYGI